MEYEQVKFYITEEQKEALKTNYNQRSSEIIRGLIDVFLMTEDESKFEGKQLAQLLIFKEKYKAEQEHKQKENELKEELFSYFTQKNVPIIYARKSKSKASKACKDLLIGFREKGYVIPDYKAKELIKDYLNLIESKGIVNKAYKSYIVKQTISYQQEID